MHAEVLQKPASISALRQVVRHLLGRPEHGTGLLKEESRDWDALLRQHKAGCRILLVDDEPINQMIACEMLEDVGLVVEVADDGAQAVAKALATPFDLILMDMQMPVLDGVSAAHQIREKKPESATPIIALTANAFSEDRQKCLAAGMNDFVSKPVDPEMLFGVIWKWLSK